MAEDKDKARQAAVDKRGYYNASDIANAKTDPKMRANFSAIAKERKAKRGKARSAKRR